MADPGTDQPPPFSELYRVLRAFVSQYERVKRAHPRGQISLKFHFGDKESESSVTTGDDEKMALFVVLMRPFFEETSIIHLPKVWNLIKGGPQVRFSEAEVKNVEQALENVKAGAIAYSRKGVKVGRDEFYRILADGSFFGSTEGASAEVSELERSMLRSFGWYQFLTFNVDVYPIVAAIARRIIRSRGVDPLRSEIKALSPSSPKCLYCLSTDAGFTSEEHVYPESLVPEYLVSDFPVLPRGVVCDECNNGVLSDLDKALMDFGPIAVVRVQLTLFSKRGRMPSARFGDVTVRKVRPRMLRFERGGKLVDPLEIGQWRADLSPGGQRKLARAFYKLGLGMLAFKAGVERALSSDFDQARSLILHDAPFRNDFVMNTSVDPAGQIRFEYRDDDVEGTPTAFSFFGNRFAVNLREYPRVQFPHDLPGAENLIIVPLDAAQSDRKARSDRGPFSGPRRATGERHPSQKKAGALGKKGSRVPPRPR